jgi:hypothetical protein
VPNLLLLGYPASIICEHSPIAGTQRLSYSINDRARSLGVLNRLIVTSFLLFAGLFGALLSVSIGGQESAKTRCERDCTQLYQMCRKAANAKAAACNEALKVCKDGCKQPVARPTVSPSPESSPSPSPDASPSPSPSPSPDISPSPRPYVLAA